MNTNYDAYKTFAEKVVGEYRFVLDDKSIAFQAILKETVESRNLTIKTDQHLYRARKGHNGVIEGFFQPYPIDSMRLPPPDKACEGRVNPKGIPCFYAADQFSTAVREMRPWIGELISVAIFRPSKELNVVDLTNDDEESIKFKQFLRKDLPSSDAEIEKQIWSELNNAFSEPISIEDQTAKYAPTQIISEWFKSWGYDGVVYKSSVHSEGKNYALFQSNPFPVCNEAGLSRVVRVSKIDVSHYPADTILTVSENSDQTK